MVVDVVGRRALASKCVYVRVVAVDHDSGPNIAQALGKQLQRPEDAILGCPGLLRMSIQAMHKDDAAQRQSRVDPASALRSDGDDLLHLGIVGAIDLGQFIAADAIVVRW